jgi:chromosome partitioning protein
MVLIPVQPSLYDVWATEDLVRLVKHRQELTEGKLKAAFVLSRRIKGTLLSQELASQLNIYDLPIFLSSTYQRVEYAKAIQEGRTVCDMLTEAYLEIIAIVNELEEKLNG